MKWRVEFDENEGVWMYANETTRALNHAGYAVSGSLNHKTGVKTYALHRADARGYPIIFETDSLEQLNAYVNLLLSTED